MATVFDKILDTTTGPKSYDWYKRKVQSMTTPGARSLISQGKATLRPKYGVMNLFGYDPKHKDKLPYYDVFPLILPLEPAKGGFLGLNLHYLPQTLRAQFLDQLYDRTNNTKFDESTRFNVTYKMLKGLSGKPYFKACVKHYLTSQIRSSFAIVDSADWEIAIFLPTESFRKSSMENVWKESRKKISG